VTYRYENRCDCGALVTGSASTRRGLWSRLSSSAGSLRDATYPILDKCACGLYLASSQGRIWRGKLGPADCDARCTWARGTDCVCACSGEHHGHDAALAATCAPTGYMFPVDR